jgi:hypothetical protein
MTTASLGMVSERWSGFTAVNAVKIPIIEYELIHDRFVISAIIGTLGASMQ